MERREFDQIALELLDGSLEDELAQEARNYLKTDDVLRAEIERLESTLHLVRRHMASFEPSAHCDQVILEAAKEALESRNVGVRLLDWWGRLLLVPAFRPAAGFAMLLLVVGGISLVLLSNPALSPKSEHTFYSVKNQPASPALEEDLKKKRQLSPVVKKDQETGSYRISPKGVPSKIARLAEPALRSGEQTTPTKVTVGGALAPGKKTTKEGKRLLKRGGVARRRRGSRRRFRRRRRAKRSGQGRASSGRGRWAAVRQTSSLDGLKPSRDLPKRKKRKKRKMPPPVIPTLNAPSVAVDGPRRPRRRAPVATPPPPPARRIPVAEPAPVPEPAMPRAVSPRPSRKTIASKSPLLYENRSVLSPTRRARLEATLRVRGERDFLRRVRRLMRRMPKSQRKRVLMELGQLVRRVAPGRANTIIQKMKSFSF